MGKVNSCIKFSILFLILLLPGSSLAAVGDYGVQGTGDVIPGEEFPGSIQTTGYESYQGEGSSQVATSAPESYYPDQMTYGANYPTSQGPSYLQGYNTNSYTGGTLDTGSQGAVQSLQGIAPGLPQGTGSMGGMNTGSGTSATASYMNPGAYLQNAPQIAGPYEEHLTPTDLNFAQPQIESFQPDVSLNFVVATPPDDISFQTGALPQQQSTSGGSWYYPGSVVSNNKLYIQTTAGPQTVAGCPQGGYLPLWASIASSGNFYTYEWYPGQFSPSVRWWSWTWPGFMKGWFHGDKTGWHILAYNCRDWSNYVYVYVNPAQKQYDHGGQQQSYVQQNYGYQPQEYQQLTSGAPTPPNMITESLVMPDYQMVPPRQGCTEGSCSQQVYTPNPVYPKQESCSCKGLSTSTVSKGSCNCNEYYIQVWPNTLTTTAGVRCGDWLSLWSKIKVPGNYWSYEWAPCSSYPHGYYCPPEVNNFGYKGTGWYPTGFYGNQEGWHILAYYTGGWSNYIYVYVWPFS